MRFIANGHDRFVDELIREGYRGASDEEWWFKDAAERDTARIVAAFAATGDVIHPTEAAIAWKAKSLDFDAGWLILPEVGDPGERSARIRQQIAQYVVRDET